jgi:DUF4097 and DUF4098 domain-containing protein YvlB
MKTNKLFGKIFYMLIVIFFLTFPIACHAQNEAASDTGSVKTEITGSQNIHKSFTVEKGQKLSINLKTGGSISITGWDKDEVNVDASIGGDDWEDVIVELEKTDSGVEIYSKYKDRHDNENSRTHFEISVPAKFDIDVNTMGGKINLDGVDGNITGKTMGGGLILSHLKGYIDLSTMGGNITLTGSDVDGKVHTMGGSVDFENVTGGVKGSSMGGKVTMKNVTRRTGESSGDEVDISSMGGAIDVDDAPNGANVSTMGGSININSVKKFVKAKTMGGNIRIDEADASVKATTMGGQINVKEICKPDDSGRDIYLESYGGTITLLVPADFSMDVDITLAYTKERDRDYQIINDFNVDQTRTNDWEHRKGSPRKYIFGKANLNGGKNKVTIKTINGDVRLEKVE